MKHNAVPSAFDLIRIIAMAIPGPQMKVRTRLDANVSHRCFPPTMMEIGALAFIGTAAYEQERTLDAIVVSYDLFRVL